MMKPLLFAAALSATLCAQAAPAGEAIPPGLVHSVRTAAKQNFCKVDPNWGNNTCASAPTAICCGMP